MASRPSSVSNGGGASLGRRTAPSTAAASSRGRQSPSPSKSPSQSTTAQTALPSLKSPRQAPSQRGGFGGSSVGGRSPSGSISGRRGGYAKSYTSWRDESITGESVISLGSIDETLEFAIPDELVRSIGMDCYTVEEKAQLDNLLQRLMLARRQDERRREKLRRELHRTMAQVSKVQSRGEQPGLLYSLCELCGAKLYLVHRRYVCNRCAYLACRSCVYLVRGAEPQCRLCRLEVLNSAKSGDWFTEEVRQRAGDQAVLTGPDILLATLSRERQRLVEQERQRREQKKAEQEERQRQLEAAEQQRPDKKGRKEHKSDKKAAAAAAGASTSGSRRESDQLQLQQQHQPAVSITVQGPDYDGDIHPDDSVSVVGAQNLDEPDGDILIEQALQARGFRQGSQSSRGSLHQEQFHRHSNLMSTDTSHSGSGNDSSLSLTDVYNTATALQQFLIGYTQRRASASCPDLTSAAATPSPAPVASDELLAAPKPPTDLAGSGRRLSGARRLSNAILSHLRPPLPPGDDADDGGDSDGGDEHGKKRRRSSVGNLPTKSTMSSAAFGSGGHFLAKPAFLHTSRESLASNVSETEASYVHGLVPSGEVEVNLQYNYKERRFTVNVVQCRNLNALDGNPPNPYVKTYLLPDKTKRSKRRTQTRRATANPIYSEQLVYDIVKSELETRTLQVSVWHSLTFGSNVFLGECRLTMENYRFDAGPEVLKLGRRVEIPVPLPTLMYRGDIMLALRYVSGELIRSNQLARDDPGRPEGRSPAAGRLEVWVQNCRNLAGSGSGASPYVKGYLINPENSGRGGRSGKDSRNKQKSAIVKGDMNPNFNSILAFDNVQLGELKDRSLELTVWDYVKLGRNDFLGGVRLNVGDGRYPCMDARGHEMLMWARMLEKPNDWVEGSLLLRPSMDCRMDLPHQADSAADHR